MTTTESASDRKSIGANVLSIVGLILGLLGLLTCGLTSLVGLILSVIGLVKHKSGLSIAGVVISALMLILGPALNFALLSWLASEGRKIQEQERAETLGSNQTFTNKYKMQMVYLKPGTFAMGSPDSETERVNSETQHQVTLSNGFYMQTTEVTQGQWKAVMGTTPWRKDGKLQWLVKEGDSYPAVYISWDDAVAFCKKLSQLTGKTYRLPTEAEWEYAARAGSTTAYSFGNDASQLDRYAWYEDNTGKVGNNYAHSVATKLPNKWGLYDMHGNVWELCSDWYGDYPVNAVTDPQGATSGTERVIRGGGWGMAVDGCRTAYRDYDEPSSRDSALGFRVVMDVD